MLSINIGLCPRCFDEREFDRQLRTRHAELLGGPGTEIGELAAFGAEGAPGIAAPGCFFSAEGAIHTPILARKSAALTLAGANLSACLGLE